MRAIANRQGVQEVIEGTKEAAHDRATDAVETVSAKLESANTPASV